MPTPSAKSSAKSSPQNEKPLSLAIACQGGGSHCAFGAGVLIEILSRLDADKCITHAGKRYRISGFSGTSGGAINALMAWYGFIHPNGVETGINSLQGFWQDNAATAFWDAIANFNIVNFVRLRGLLPQVEMAPGQFSGWAQQRLQSAIEKQVTFRKLQNWLADSTAHRPALLIGAADVLEGHFKPFGGDVDFMPRVEHLLASAAVPELFNAVEIDGHYYWDGLLSQNPPIREFLAAKAAEDKPDAIWIIRINPITTQDLPQQLSDIMDRRNEMSGNLALEQEYFLIHQVNEWLTKGYLTGPYKQITCEEIGLGVKTLSGGRLDYASKLDRRPDFLSALINLGRDTAYHFLEKTN